MTNPFTITVNYKGEECDFTAQHILHGYIHQFKVLIDQLDIYFEPDEEDSYRVVKMPWQEQKVLEKIDMLLLFEIQQKLETLLKKMIRF